MSKHTVLTRKAAMTLGALHGFLKPRLAQDAKLDLTPILAKVTSKNFAQQKPIMLKSLTRALDGKLAKDASVEGLTELLDALEGEKAMDDPLPLETEPSAGAPPKEEDKSMDEHEDSEVHERIKAFLRDKLSPEDMAEVEQMIAGEVGDAEPEDVPATRPGTKNASEEGEDEEMEPDEEGATDEPPPVRGQPKPGGEMVTKDSMQRHVKAAVEAERRSAQAVRDAERFVRPWVGDIALACDSAADVYKTALVGLGVDVKGVHPSAYKVILERTPRPSAQRHDATLASDSSEALADFAKRYPEAVRIKLA